MAMTSATLNVKGMSCNHCVNSIESALKELSGIQSAKVDLQANIVTVSYNNDVLDLDKVKEAIAETGYDVA